MSTITPDLLELMQEAANCLNDSSPGRTPDNSLARAIAKDLQVVIEAAAVQPERTPEEQAHYLSGKIDGKVEAHYLEQQPVGVPQCVCGIPTALGIVHRLDGPCFVYEPELSVVMPLTEATTFSTEGMRLAEQAGLRFSKDGEYSDFFKFTCFLEALHKQYIAAAPVSVERQGHPIEQSVRDDLERSDWTPEEALRFYAAGRHYDTVPSRDGTSNARILDNGAIASNALKSMSHEYAKSKGDVALLGAVEPQGEPIVELPVVAAFQKFIDSVQFLIDSSSGIYGLHINGDKSPWEELLQGGFYDVWLGLPISEAQAAIAAQGEKK
jgi:hypothetical protein